MSGYPIVMVKGSAMIPQRFWEYRICKNLHEALGSDKDGFVRSNKKVEDITVAK